jgi:predicted nucleic acid-binding protein
LFAKPPALVTSALVIAEAHGWFLRRYDQHRALQLLIFIGQLPKLTIRAFDAEELDATSKIIKKFSDQKLTLVDAHGLAILAARRIAVCWSTDRHLGLTGVPLVI